MNSEYSTPTLSQQHSPMLMNIQYAQQQQQQQQQQMASGTSEISIVAPFNLAHSQIDISTPTTAVDINSAHFAYLKDAFPARSFSPSTMDFASMNIASGYHTPLPATPVALTHQQSQQIQQSQQQVAQPSTPPQSDVSGNVSGNAAPSPPVNASDSAPSEATLTTDSATTLSSDKPDFSYASLIAQSLEDAPLQRRTLNGIYEWIQENFPYYRTRQNWQNSIRHNLSLNKGFMKVKRDEAHPGKGSFWTFTPGYESFLNSGHFKPVRSRSGRAALAAAAAMAAAKSTGNGDNANLDNEGMDIVDQMQDAAASAVAEKASPASKKADKKVTRTIKAAKSLKRSHSVPPKEQHELLTRNGLNGTASTTSLPSTNSMASPSSETMMHCDNIPVGVRGSVKKMRVSSSQSHMGTACSIPPSALSAVTMSHQQASFAQSPAFHASPALLSAAPMTMVNTNTHTHTPLNQSAQFHFQMQSPCSVPMPMSAMDLASVPATSGPYLNAFVGHFNDPATAAMDGSGMFVESMENMGSSNNGDMVFTARRPTNNLQSRLSWHGPESVTQAFANIQQQHQQHQQHQFHNQHHHQQHFHHQQQQLQQQPQQQLQQRFANNMGVSMNGEIQDMTLPMLGDGHPMGLIGDGTINGSPAEWAMFTGMQGPVPGPVSDMQMHPPQLHHMASMGALDAHGNAHMHMSGHNHGHSHSHSHSSIGQAQGRMANVSTMEAAVSGNMAAGSDNGNNQGILAFYDEMLRDPSSLMSVLGQDLAGWQCPSKTNTIDPAALCAVDPESNNNML